MQTTQIQIAYAAGILRADEAWDANGWRKAPAQCPILMGMLTGLNAKQMMPLMDAWNRGFQTRNNQRSDEALTA